MSPEELKQLNSRLDRAKAIQVRIDSLERTVKDFKKGEVRFLVMDTQTSRLLQYSNDDIAGKLQGICTLRDETDLFGCLKAAIATELSKRVDAAKADFANI